MYDGWPGVFILPSMEKPALASTRQQRCSRVNRLCFNNHVAHKTKAIAAIELLAYGDDTRLQSRYGNPQALVHDSETDENPRGVWAFKRLPPAA
jgi:hypothetical protein